MSASLDLSLDRAYREVVSFAATPSEIPPLVNRLLGNRTLLSLRSRQGREFIEGKVCPSLSQFDPLPPSLQMSTGSLCEPLVSLVRSSAPAKAASL
jgi:hypothetical protein